MIRRVNPAPIRGELTPPPSKSAAHRTLIAAALAGGGRVEGILPSADMQATLDALEALGLEYRLEGDTATIAKRPLQTLPAEPVVNCRESGSTLRFCMPIFAALGISAVFTGEGRLPERPLGVYADCLPRHGVSLETAGGLPLRLEGRLEGGLYGLPGNVSSQFITGLLFALPLCAADSEIRLTSPLESAGYVDMTLRTLKEADIRIDRTAAGWHIPGGQCYRRRDYRVESDWSQAAFLLAAGALGGEVTLTGLDPASAQGDREALELFRRFGAAVTMRADGAIVCRKAPLRGIEIDASQIPDLVPVLAVTAAAAEGETRIFNAGRLRLKESDRLAAVTHCLRLLGAEVEELPEELRIHGGRRLRGGSVPGFNDHRIVMSMAVAALFSDGPVEIADAEAVAKSWPAFFEDYARIGGMTDGIEYR